MEYIASFSGGKDSAATIILAHEHNEPLDEIVFCEVMYSETISGELPEQRRRKERFKGFGRARNCISRWRQQ